MNDFPGMGKACRVSGLLCAAGDEIFTEGSSDADIQCEILSSGSKGDEQVCWPRPGRRNCSSLTGLWPVSLANLIRPSHTVLCCEICSPPDLLGDERAGEVFIVDGLAQVVFDK